MARWSRRATIEDVDAYDDVKTFTRELLLRFGKQQDAVIAELVAQRHVWQADMAEQRRAFARLGEDVRGEMRDLREESRAQRQALLRILDRLDGGGASA